MITMIHRFGVLSFGVLGSCLACKLEITSLWSVMLIFMSNFFALCINSSAVFFRQMLLNENAYLLIICFILSTFADYQLLSSPSVL